MNPGRQISASVRMWLVGNDVATAGPSSMLNSAHGPSPTLKYSNCAGTPGGGAPGCRLPAGRVVVDVVVPRVVVVSLVDVVLLAEGCGESELAVVRSDVGDPPPRSLSLPHPTTPKTSAHARALNRAARIQAPGSPLRFGSARTQAIVPYVVM